jgi:hypothetical protein
LSTTLREKGKVLVRRNPQVQKERKFNPEPNPGNRFISRDNRKSNKTYAEQTEGIDKSELDRRKAAGECQRCAWPGDRKGAHKTMDCYRWKRMEKGTAPFPKPKAYQQLKVGAYNQQEEVSEDDPIDLYTTNEEDCSDSEDEGISDSEEECLEDEESDS